MKKYKINYKIVVPLIIMAIISIVSIYSALNYTSSTLGNLALKQLLWYIVGTILIVILAKFGNEYLYRQTWILYLVGNLLLVLLLIFGKPINNSKCWLIIPGIGSIQPSEFMKIFIMLALANLIHDFRKRHKYPSIKEEFKFIIKTFLVVLVPSVLTFLEPDTGAVIIYLIIYLTMLFVSGIRNNWFLIGLISVLGILGIILLIYFFKESLFISMFGSSIFYRLNRIADWKNGYGLQLENALAAIGSAGLFGHGFRNTPIYFPESSTDFIFAVFASNFGFIGVIVLITCIIYFDINLINLARNKINDTDKYILAGIIGMLLFQQIQNISMTIGLLPITGITLPFISYGGSSLLSYLILIGIILNISNTGKRNYLK